ncbi:DASH complex subunit ask1 [Haplosporangium sp. Z 27]|nr:DASH complex subunit ask1 [Haplosporangium sp. Z 27]
MASSPRSTADVLDEIERLEQSITRTLQEIDQSFSDCQIIVSSKILPQIDRYAETSQGVWEHARLWLNFFEAAASTTTPTVGRRAQAARDAKSKQQAAMESEQSHLESTTTPEYDDNSTNRQRIDSINLSSPRLSSDFFGGSPLGSMPSTPTPARGGRKITQYIGDTAPPAGLDWPDLQSSDNAPSTPTRPPYNFKTSTAERGSTTPLITSKDRPLPASAYTQSEPPRTPSRNSPHPTRRSQDGGFVEIDIEENYQDVITPPSTLHFSVPESKLATTPRSVVAKSRVDTIRMKDGLVIPQPIFVNDDEEDDALVTEKYVGGSILESGIGGSRKRIREGDLQDPEGNDIDTRTKGWASLTDQQRNKERLLKSPRKMASVQDFFAPESSTTASTPPPKSTGDVNKPHHSEESENGDNDAQSPSRDLMSQIEAQANTEEGEEEEDPLLAALATPPETRKAIMDRKVRDSLLPQLRTTSSTLSTSSSSSLLSRVSAPIFSMPGLTRPSSGTTVNPVVTTASSSSTHESLLTTAPNGTTTTDSPAINSNAIGATFMASFNSAFAATSSRRQTMATPAPRSNFPININQGQQNRNSVGPGYRLNLTPAPFATPRPAGSTASRLSLLGSTRRYPEPSSAGRAAAASIIASAAATSSSQTTSQANNTNGVIHEGSQGDSDGFSFNTGGDRTAQLTSTPIVSTASMLAQGRSYPSTSSTTGSVEKSLNAPDSDFSSRGFLTPFANRNPPPAPRLGYHSDTLMTQSSLGLNHDGFGFDSEDRTRMTMISSGGSSGIMSGVSVGGGGISSSTVDTDGQQGSAEQGDYGDDEEGTDEDMTDHIMKSPCPPGKTFYGPNTDLRSVAQAAAAARGNGGPSLFRRQ